MYDTNCAPSITRVLAIVTLTVSPDEVGAPSNPKMRFYVGRILGQGSYSIVKELNEVRFSNKDSRCLALKQPRSDLNPKKREQANEEIKKETRILACLMHANIVKTL